MALSDKKRQKKREQKMLKRKEKVQSKPREAPAGKKAANFAGFPVYETLVPENLFDIGIGSVLLARKIPNGNLAVSAFVVDVFCLGIKNGLFQVFSESYYRQNFKPQFIESQEGDVEEIDPSCLKKIIEGARSYAEDLGFKPHRDYYSAKDLLKGIDTNDCPVSYTFGKDGKPYYVRGPKETIGQAQRIVHQLRDKCGEDGFHHLIILDEPD
ncbi:MAG: hypothetical protein K9K79_09005 [Desulfohalobiaceae bacterium]|nr:hypothetical protein [Desulfohalobiaceae bacterium]